MKVGEFQIQSLETGRFKLDGGAMFGSVPKKLWERAIPADADNRIDMAARIVLLQDLKSGRHLLMDTGNGHKWPEKLLKIYAIDYSEFTLEKSLAQVGLKETDITDVVLTHLHFDHAGGATKINDAGQIVPSFPNATYYVQKDNYEWATKPNSRESASYLPENFEPLVAAGILEICDGVDEFSKKLNWPGFEVFISYGHTIGLQAPIVRIGNETFFYPADMIPTSHHVPIPWVMGYDIHVIKLLEEKEQLLQRAATENWTLIYEHDPKIKASKVRKTEKHYEAFEPASEI